MVFVCSQLFYFNGISVLDVIRYLFQCRHNRLAQENFSVLDGEYKVVMDLICTVVSLVDFHSSSVLCMVPCGKTTGKSFLL